MKKLFLIPTPISEDLSSIPPQIIDTLKTNRVFICERVRTSRRFVRSVLPKFNIDSSQFVELNKRESIRDNREIVDLLKKGEEICFMSEAGSPCIADPGSELVALARQQDYQIISLSGPSSIILALMASGMNGQQFTFRGYLPVKKDVLKRELKQIEKTIVQTGFTQVFIETPYRNLQLFDHILGTISSSLQLHLALNIHSKREYLETKTIQNWKKDQKIKTKLEEKAPCIFILGK